MTAFLPTFITAPEPQLLAALREVPAASDGARVLGVHLEGPFLSALRLGIHPAAARSNPDLELLDRLLDAGPVRLVTLAPGASGRQPGDRAARPAQIAVSAGHSGRLGRAGERRLRPRRAERDAPLQRHASFHHRDPGIAGAALARPDVVVQLILDWVHVAPVTAAMVWQAAQAGSRS